MTQHFEDGVTNSEIELDFQVAQDEVRDLLSASPLLFGSYDCGLYDHYKVRGRSSGIPF